MKKIYTSVVLLFTAVVMHAQCFVTASGTNVTCNGLCNGTATATAAGIPPINYLWSPGGQTTATISGLCAGTYTVSIVDGSSCNSTATVTITAPAAITALSSKTNIPCNGLCNGTATAFVSGGTAPYSHKWNSIPVQASATADSLCVGNYYDTISDANGCSFILGPVSITEPAPLAAMVTCSSVSCFGGSNGSATASQVGGTGSFTYAWNTIPVQTTATITGLTPGTYSCTVTDANGCSSTSGCTVNQPSAPLATNSTSTDASCASCCNGSATVTPSGGTPGGYTYMWSPGGQTTATISAVCPGNYTVCVTDPNGCSQCDTVSVNFTTGITGAEDLMETIRIYPNPAHDYFEIEMMLPSASSVTFTLYDLIGAEISAETVTASGSYKKNFSMQTLPPGVYFLRTGVAGKYATQKIVKY
jgi:hypothetical protein